MSMTRGKKIGYAALVAALFCGAVYLGVRIAYPSERAGELSRSESSSPFGFSLLSILYRMSAPPVSAEFTPPKEGRVVLADLPKRTIMLYENGSVTATVPIVSIGKPGTPWETPAGSYEVLTKEDLHFSSLGNVWMPYSMHFFGNFFVHGWPYYPNGDPVGEGYSGGCIRLKTEDARVLYNFVNVGTRIHVLGGEGIREQEKKAVASYYLTKGGDSPQVSASAYAVADAETGALLFARNMNTVGESASLARLMAALASVEVVNQFAPLPVTFPSGEMDTVLGDDAVALLLEGNESALEVFRSRAGEQRFAAAMKGKAHAMGLMESAFTADPLMATTTTKDMSIFARYLYRNKQYFFNKTRVTEESVTGTGGTQYSVVYPQIVVGENGAYRGGVIVRASGDGMVLVELPLSEFEKRPISISVLGSSDPAHDIETITEFVRTHFVHRPEGSLVQNILSADGENALSKALKFLQSAALAHALKKGEGLRDGESRVILSP